MGKLLVYVQRLSVSTHPSDHASTQALKWLCNPDTFDSQELAMNRPNSGLSSHNQKWNPCADEHTAEVGLSGDGPCDSGMVISTGEGT